MTRSTTIVGLQISSVTCTEHSPNTQYREHVFSLSMQTMHSPETLHIIRSYRLIATFYNVSRGNLEQTRSKKIFNKESSQQK